MSHVKIEASLSASVVLSRILSQIGKIPRQGSEMLTQRLKKARHRK